MIIPNDTGYPWRLRKFIHYQNAVPSLDVATCIGWAQKVKLNPNDCVTLAWYHSMTYADVTAVFLLEHLPVGEFKIASAQTFWKDAREVLKFGSDRIYVKSNNMFVPLLTKFVHETNWLPMGWLLRVAGEGTEQEQYNRIYREVLTWPYVGRFSADRFIDVVSQMSWAGLLGHFRIRSNEFKWNDGSNMTSGALNILYRDEEADVYDKKKRIEPEAKELLDRLTRIIPSAVKFKYPLQDNAVTKVFPKMCSFRNLFKGKRYGGWHHDRQLMQIRSYEKSFPLNPLWDRLYNLRKETFAPGLLGEIGGWDGIRKERCRLWLDYGLTGVEEI